MMMVWHRRFPPFIMLMASAVRNNINKKKLNDTKQIHRVQVSPKFKTRSWLKFNKLGKNWLTHFPLTYPIFNINKTSISSTLFLTSSTSFKCYQELKLHDKFQAMNFMVKHSPQLYNGKKKDITTHTQCDDSSVRHTRYRLSIACYFYLLYLFLLLLFENGFVG